MSMRRAFICGVPRDRCTGSQSPHSDNPAPNTHHTSAEAYECMERYLVSQGFTRLGNHSFSPPDGGPVRVISKRGRYGAVVRNGKENTRFMWNRHVKRGLKSCRDCIARV